MTQTVFISSHAADIAFYNTALFGTYFSIGSWTQCQWGGLVGTVALNIFRPSIQKPVDEWLGKSSSRALFDLTPFFVMGFTQWRANRHMKTAFLNGAFFATASKIINWQQHLKVLNHVWGSHYFPKQKADPCDYCEELEIQRQELNHALEKEIEVCALTLKQIELEIQQQELNRALEKKSEVCELTLIQIEEGTALFNEYQTQLRVGLYNQSLEAQLSYFIDQNDEENALKTIKIMEKSLEGKSYFEKFSCYVVMIHAYAHFKKCIELEQLQQKIDQEISELC